jgi:hypothetical protein
MRLRFSFVAVLAGLSGMGCGSDDSGPRDEFDPPPARAGYTRLVAPLIEAIEPGADLQFCQIIYAPQDRDLDILDVTGFQSRLSHHAVAYAVKDPAPVGTSAPCGNSDSMAGVYVGGIGGEGGGGMTMPEGAAFRLPKNHGILLNAHFVNVTKETLTGESVLDVKFAEVDPTRKVMSLFTNMDLGFELKPGVITSSQAECTFPKDMEFLMIGNHMHHRGRTITTELVTAGGSQTEVLHEDADWTPEMEYRAVFSQWTTATPLVVKKGDIVRTRCTWMNESADALRFPAEMCIGIGFFLSDGTSSPACMNGAWLENGASLR